MIQRSQPSEAPRRTGEESTATLSSRRVLSSLAPSARELVLTATHAKAEHGRTPVQKAIDSGVRLATAHPFHLQR